MTSSKKRCVSCKNSSPGSKAYFSKKFVFGIWRLMLSRYDIKWYIYDIILNIVYIKGPIKIGIQLAIHQGLLYRISYQNTWFSPGPHGEGYGGGSMRFGRPLAMPRGRPQAPQHSIMPYSLQQQTSKVEAPQGNRQGNIIALQGPS